MGMVAVILRGEFANSIESHGKNPSRSASWRDISCCLHGIAARRTGSGVQAVPRVPGLPAASGGPAGTARRLDIRADPAAGKLVGSPGLA